MDPEFYEYLSEYRLQTNNEPISHYEEGELEAQWLVSAGFPELTKPFEHGQELQSAALEPIIATLSRPHAEAVKQRVRALNRTVRGRTKSRYKRKPDIRDVFRDFDESSTGTRSRSATPDSLDSIPGDHETWNQSTIPNFVSIFDTSLTPPGKQKQKLRRTPSAPLRGSADLFRGSHVRCDIPFHTAEGIELLGFSRIGTIHIPRIRSGSDPSCSVGRARGSLIKNARSHNNISIDHNSSDEYLSGSSSPPLLLPQSSSSGSSSTKDVSTSSQKIIINNNNNCHKNSPIQSAENSPNSRGDESISFENMCRETSQRGIDMPDGRLIEEESTFDIDTINEQDLKKLHKLFWLELAALFDKNHVTLDKRKPFKRRRKEEGNLFGVSLNALIRRDQQITGEDSTLVPLFLQGVLNQLINRGANEKGILRVAGHKQKTEILYNELELVFYQKPDKVQQLLNGASCHDLSALLKRWLRELPQPLLSCELIQLFYQIHALPPPDQYKALSIVCLLLPHENRNTLRSIMKFLNYIIDKQDSNKMTKHNVATIIAPSFFPPRYIHPVDKNNISDQVKMVAECCQLANVLITRGESLFMVPKRLIEQSRCTKIRQGKRAVGHRRVKLAQSLDEVREINPNHVHRIII